MKFKNNNEKSVSFKFNKKMFTLQPGEDVELSVVHKFNDKLELVEVDDIVAVVEVEKKFDLLDANKDGKVSAAEKKKKK